MRHPVYVVPAALMATALLATACGNSTDSGSTSTVTVTGATSASAPSSPPSAPAGAGTPPATPSTAAAGADLPSLLPAPANNQRADGPDPVGENGIHKHFLVNGAPTDVMNAYKDMLEGAGWSLTVQNSGSGGATYTGTNGDAYGVFTGGGYGGSTDVDACAWPTKPTNTNCG